MEFPLSGTCLWYFLFTKLLIVYCNRDTQSIGDTCHIHVTTSGWLEIKLSTSSVRLALRHASFQHEEAFFMATPLINSDTGAVLLDVNRYDPGKFIDGALQPTTVLCGDVIVQCKIIKDDTINADGYTTHNISTLQQSFTSIQKQLSSTGVCHFFSLLSVRIVIFEQKNVIKIKCGCVLPASFLFVTPINSIPILSTSLSRNLMGPLPLSTLQGQIRTGYLTMNETRKLVPLLSTDNQLLNRPLVGIWLSGTQQLTHPAIWSTALHFTLTSLPLNRLTYNDHFLLLTFSGRSGQYNIWQCQVEPLKWAWHVSNAQIFELSWEYFSGCLMPVVEGFADYLLLETASSNWEGSSCHDDSLPLPGPVVTPSTLPVSITSDNELSTISQFDVQQEVFKAEDAVSRDQSCDITSCEDRSLPSVHTVTSIVSRNSTSIDCTLNNNESLLMETDSTIVSEGMDKTNLCSSIANSSIHSNINVIHSNADKTHSGVDVIHSNADKTHSGVDVIHSKADSTHSNAADKVHSSAHRTCSGASITNSSADETQNSTIRTQSSTDTFIDATVSYSKIIDRDVYLPICTDTSYLPILKIQCPSNTSSISTDTTFDSYSNMAEFIEQKYLLHNSVVPTSGTVQYTGNTTEYGTVDYSIATQEYLRRNNLTTSTTTATAITLKLPPKNQTKLL